MYCERCGNATDEALNYCNSCGAQLRHETRPPRSLTAFLIAAVSVTMIFGLFVIGALLLSLLDRVNRPEPVFVFAMVFLIVLFGVCYMMMRQVSKLIDADLKAREFPQRTARPAVQLPPRSTNQLEEFREPASVTDHTTKTLAEVPIRKR
jgi:hypothetical protein